MRGSIFSLRSNTSRASSPAPPATPPQIGSRPDSGVYINDVEPLSLPPPASPAPAPRSRPLTRLSLTPFRRPSPSPASHNHLNPQSGMTAVLSSSNVNTPVPSPSLSPALHPAGSGSYLDALGLKLGEAVAKALLPPSTTQHHHHSIGLTKSSSSTTLASSKVANGASSVAGSDVLLRGKRAVPPGRGRTLGSLINGELHNASQVLNDHHLYRAILRLLQRPLSVLLTNLSQQVTGLILTPEFTPSSPLLSLNPTQVHAIALAHFASELLETFDTLGLGRTAGPGQGPDGLKAIREGLENVISKVLSPLLTVLKADAVAALDEMEGHSTTEAHGPQMDKLEKTLVRVSGLVARLTMCVPNTGGQSVFIQSLIATFNINIVWRSMIALAHRPLPASATPVADALPIVTARPPMIRSSSAGELARRSSKGSLLSNSSTSSGEYGGGQLPSYVTPPDTPQVQPIRNPPNLTPSSMKEKKASSGISLGLGLTMGASSKSNTAVNPARLPTPPSTNKFSLAKLPSLSVMSMHPARAASPQPTSEAGASASSATSSPVTGKPPVDALQFTRGPSFPHPHLPALRVLSKDSRELSEVLKKLPKPQAGIANEAVDEALEKMDGFVCVIEYLVDALTIKPPKSEKESGRAEIQVDKLMEKTRLTPMLGVLPIILRVGVTTSSAVVTNPSSEKAMLAQPQDSTCCVSGYLGLPADEYRRGCLGGFGKADECAAIVGSALLKSNKFNIEVAGHWLKEWINRSVEEAECDSDTED
ncbi:hypothetical protein FRC02_003223 [Tulasnella sp. 418]|nr:hypothetical protein FRC02_003223 [Tulasnella sp. 418]